MRKAQIDWAEFRQFFHVHDLYQIWDTYSYKDYVPGFTEMRSLFSTNKEMDTYGETKVSLKQTKEQYNERFRINPCMMFTNCGNNCI